MSQMAPREKAVAHSPLGVSQITGKPKLAAPQAQKGAIFSRKHPIFRQSHAIHQQ
jgi:hypothetical protein